MVGRNPGLQNFPLRVANQFKFTLQPLKDRKATTVGRNLSSYDMLADKLESCSNP